LILAQHKPKPKALKKKDYKQIKQNQEIEILERKQ